MNARERWSNYLPQIGLAADQFLNALIPPIYTLSWADETMSARIWRAARRNRRVGVWLLQPVDWMFSRQKPDPTIKDATGEPITSHCHRAYEKEKLRRNLPPEYREATTTDPKG